MSPLYSVRMRLLLLAGGLMALLIGSNLFLRAVLVDSSDVAARRVAQAERVQLARVALDAFVTYRELEAGGLSERMPAERQALRRSLDQHLQGLLPVDPELVELVQRAQQSRSARAQDDPTALLSHLEARGLAQAAESALRSALLREQAALSLIHRQEREGMQSGARWAGYTVVSAILLGGLLTWVIGRSVVTPLRTTVTAIRRVNAGQLDVDLPPVTPDEFGDVAIALRQFRDRAEHLDRLAYFDTLTGLGNRARLDQSLSEAIHGCQQRGDALAVLLMDVDNLKSINDAMGHRFGDRYLRAVAERLARLAPAGAPLFRYSGDEFVVLLPSLPRDAATESRAVATAERIREGLAEMVCLDDQQLAMSVSIGVSCYPAAGLNGEELVSCADAALSQAKRDGRNAVSLSNRRMTDAMRNHLAVASDIRRGLDAAEFEPYFQPIVDVTQGRVVGAEALLRWQHPRRGMVMPGEFIQVAEDSGAINALGTSVLRRGFEQAALWQQAGRKIRLAINISAKQLREPGIVDAIRALFEETGLKPSAVQLEITESAMMERPEVSARVLAEMKALGLTLAMDDFGTGYSSLSYLQRFPLDRIKIDRSFVARLDGSPQTEAIVTATLAMARGLGLQVVAEGVETREQMTRLAQLGCDLQQGYLFTPPLSAQDFDGWVDAPQRWLQQPMVMAQAH